MKIGKLSEFLKNEFVYGGHLLSLGASSIVFTAALILDIKITWDCLLVSYLVTYIAYSYNRLVEFRSDSLSNPLRTRHIAKSISILPSLLFLAVALSVGVTLAHGSIQGVILVVSMIVGSVLYTLYFKKLTRHIVGFKSFYVSLFWALLIILLTYYYSINFSVAAQLLFLFVLLRFIVSTVFFDLKDIKSDQKSGLKTIPVYFGKKKTLDMLHLLNIISFLPLIIGFSFEIFPKLGLALLPFYFYSFYYIKAVNSNNVNLHNISYIMVDGEYLLWSFAVIIFSFC